MSIDAHGLDDSRSMHGSSTTQSQRLLVYTLLGCILASSMTIGLTMT